MQTPLVSIIVPIYKVEPYLRRCLDSIVNQTYTNLEIILVDDGSPDGCPQICDEYAAKDNRIVVIHKENGGLSDARNAGLDICKGEYISFVDSDDWVDEKYIEILLNLIINNNAEIAVSNFKRIFKESINHPQKQINKASSIEILNNREAVIKLFGTDVEKFVTAWGKIYKRRLFENIYYPLRRLNEDEYTTYKILYLSKKVVYIDIPLYLYFQRKDSIMGQLRSCPLGVLKSRVERFLFFKEKKDPELANISFQNLCWDLLFAYSENLQEHQSTGYASREAILSDFLICQKEVKERSSSLFEKIFLFIFSKFPNFYILYRKLSPFKIRKYPA